MRIAVIGATGVLGRAVIPSLISKQHHALAISPHPDKARALYGSAVEAAVGDLVDPDAEAHFARHLKGCDAVLNIATAIPKHSDLGNTAAWLKSDQIRKAGTPRLIKAALAAGVQTFVQQSITMAYPDSGDRWISEETEVVSPDIIEMEAALRAVSAGSLRWIILRGASFVGTGTFQDDTIRALKAGVLSVGCDGQAYQSYVHVNDMAEAVVLATEKSPAGQVLNICAEPLREGDYLRQLARGLGAAAPVNNPKAPCPPSQRCSNRAATNILGWQPTHSILPHGLH
jgi:nucleoside-diphosphate-sugar epimerase